MTEKSLPPPPTVPRQRITELHHVYALYDYVAQSPAELSFEEGDTILILKQVDENWLSGRIGDNMGLVPISYVSETMKLESPLHDAAKRGNLEILQNLVKLGMDLTSKDSAGNLPLHWACRTGHLACIEFLLKQNSQVVNEQNSLGDTPLHLACWGNRYDAVSALLSVSDINPQLKNNQGNSPYELARNDDIKALLIEFLNAKALGSIEPNEDSDKE